MFLTAAALCQMVGDRNGCRSYQGKPLERTQDVKISLRYQPIDVGSLARKCRSVACSTGYVNHQQALMNC
jgi:hypothetical protein